jgi:glycosyltransferase involved in cell wall biosynthesis
MKHKAIVARRVKLVVYHAGEGLGGVEVSMATLLSNFDRRVEIVLLGSEPSVIKWFAKQLPSARVVRIPKVQNKWDFAGMLNHWRTVRSLKPDIFHVDLVTPWSGKYALLAGVLAPGVKVIAVDYTGLPAHNRKAIWAKRLLMAATSANVAISAELAAFIEDVARQARGSVRVIYQGISDPGSPVSPHRRQDPPVIGTIARLTRQKGIDIFLRALADIPDVLAVVVGDGEDEEELKGLAKDLGIAERVSWMGWRDDARALVEGFDVFVLPSRWEGFGRVLVEAEFAECPVVATRVVGTSEAMVDGETGFLVPPENKEALVQAIKRLLEDEVLAREMGRRGREFALSRFEPAATARRFEALYDEILGRTPVSAGSIGAS